ncbi:DEAD/DEAH box helicase [Conexibacter sp. DBS9H8]|uniref:DEAD/DEAH box helicase n=1 Tax=Conexibacter sp. DBS9H8 TaxID=2937801 RepID=UPI00200D5D70|nr:DEAD/DEAH box helicase [Conexibacter sp. DBS9H8]
MSVAARTTGRSAPGPAAAPRAVASASCAPGAAGDGLREWQRRALAAMANWTDGSFLISAAPGAGKTRPALELVRAELTAARPLSGIVITCPTAPLTRQWARAAHALGIDLAPDADSPAPPRGFHGVVVTYARVSQAPARWAAGVRDGTLVIADEAHHLGEELSWGTGFGTAFAAARRWLLLSGTPFRSDASAIPGVSYDADGTAEPDISYTYADAVREGVCRPVHFVTYDGTLSWRSGDDVIEAGFDTVLSTREASRRYRTAISTDLPDGLPRILAEADRRLRAIRAGTLAGGPRGRALKAHPDAGGLVIAADSEHARQIARLLHEAIGFTPTVVLHQDPRAAAKLAAFTRSDDPWIVAVNMVSEGVDIPRLRVGVYATAAKTPLIFRQIVGRFVRTIPGRPAEPSWLYLPADPILRDHAARVEEDVRVSRRRRGEEDAEEAAFDEPDGPAVSEPSAQLDFEALSADVAAQMTLFGPAPATVAPAPASPLPAYVRAPLPAPAPAAAVPAYERRARLRKERHQLVGDLARRDGLTHQQVNRQINQAVGVTSVEKATIEQLTASITQLEAWLRRRR